MNIKEYMNNPAGKGAVIPGKQLLIHEYESRYRELVKDKPITLNIYELKGSYFYHFLIKTEAEDRDNAYDVVLKFSPMDLGQKVDNSLKNWEMRVFSNCPSFTYTYAYVAGINGYLVDELKDKYGDTVLNQPPTTRNPAMLFNFEKSIYFACKYIMDKNYLLKSYANNASKKADNKFFESIRHIDVIDEEIKREKAIAKADKEGLKPDRVPSYKQPRQYKPIAEPKPKSTVNYIKPRKANDFKNSTVKKVSKTNKKDQWKKKSTVKKIKKH